MMANRLFHPIPLLDYPKIVSMICSRANTGRLLSVENGALTKFPAFRKSGRSDTIYC